MKHTIKLVALAALLPSLAMANGDTSTNKQINESGSYSSGTLANYQVNNNNDTRHRVGNAVCAAPSMDIGMAGRPDDGDTAMVYAAFTYPFGGSTCEDAQKAELIGMEYDIQTKQIEQNKRDILFQNKMASVCVALSKSVIIDESNLLWEECKDFTPK